MGGGDGGQAFVMCGYVVYVSNGGGLRYGIGECGHGWLGQMGKRDIGVSDDVFQQVM